MELFMHHLRVFLRPILLVFFLLATGCPEFRITEPDPPDKLPRNRAKPDLSLRYGEICPESRKVIENIINDAVAEAANNTILAVLKECSISDKREIQLFNEL